MSLSLVLRRRDDEIVQIPSGEILLAGLEVLDATAEAAGLKGPSDYADAREVPEDFEGDLDDLRALLGDSQDWFDTEEAAGNFDQLAVVLGTGDAARLADAAREVADLLRAQQGEFQFDVL